MVAELLEPVIRQWLDSNLPRLIEKAVREEVARAVAAERERQEGVNSAPPTASASPAR